MAVGRWLKRILVGVAALVALLFAAAVAALMLIDTDALKGIIAEQVEANTGRELRIEGPLELSVFPWLGFELGSARLANASGFGDAPFAALERAELRVRILPLFQRRVALDTVVLHGLDVNLARNEQGTTNWADLAGDGQPAAEPEPEPEPQAEPGGGLAGVSLRVEAIELTDATFSWRDATTGQAFAVRDLDLATGTLEPGLNTPVRLSVAFEQEGGPAVDVNAASSLTFDPSARTARLTDLEVNIDANGESLPGGNIAAVLQADVAVDAKAGTATIQPLELTLLERLNASGRIDARFGDAVPTFEGNFSIAEFSPRKVADALDVALPESADANTLSRAALDFRFAGTPSQIRVEDIDGRLDETRLAGYVDAAFGEIPSATFDFDVDAIDVDRYLPEGSGAPAAAAATDEEADAADPIASLPLQALRGVDVEGHAGIDRVGYRGIDLSDVRLDFRLAGGVLTLDRADLGVAGGTLRTNGRLDARSDAPAVRLQTSIGGVRAEPFLNAFVGTAPITGALDSTLAIDTAGGTLDQWIGALNGRLAATFSEGAVQGINLARQLRVAAARLQGEEVEEAAETRRTDFSILRFAGEIRDGVLHAKELDLRAPLLRVSGDGTVHLGKRDMDYTARVKLTGTLKGEGGAGASELRGLEVPIRFKGPLTGPSIDIQLAKAFERRESAEIRAKKEAAEQEAEQRREEAEAEAEAAVEAEKQRLEEKKQKAEERAKEKLEEKLKGVFD